MTFKQRIGNHLLDEDPTIHVRRGDQALAKNIIEELRRSSAEVMHSIGLSATTRLEISPGFTVDINPHAPITILDQAEPRDTDESVSIEGTYPNRHEDRIIPLEDLIGLFRRFLISVTEAAKYIEVTDCISIRESDTNLIVPAGTFLSIRIKDPELQEITEEDVNFGFQITSSEVEYTVFEIELSEDQTLLEFLYYLTQHFRNQCVPVITNFQIGQDGDLFDINSQ